MNVLVVKLAFEFAQELFYPGTVRISTSVTRIGTTSFAVVQTVEGPAGLVATSEAVCVLMDSATGRPARVPDPVRSALLASTG